MPLKKEKSVPSAEETSKKGPDEINTSFNEVSIPFESIYSLRLKEWSRQIPVAKLSTEWEKCILDLIPSRMKKRHPSCVKKNLAEVRNIYENDMVNCAIVSIVVTNIDDNNDPSQLPNRIGDRRFGYHYEVPRQRQLFVNKYFLSHFIMRQIVEIASVKLDQLIVDLDFIIEHNNRNNLFELSALRDTMTSNVDRVAATIKNEYYPEIVKSIVATIANITHSSDSRRNFGKTNFVSGNDEISVTYKLLRCATNLFGQQILKLMIKSIDELTERLTDQSRLRPRLNLRLVWTNDSNDLSIDPPITQIFSMWHSLVDSIENIADDLTAFEQRAATIITDDCHRMKISLPDWYAIECHRKIDETLTNALVPLEKYIIEITDKFKAVTSGETRRSIRELVSINSDSRIIRNVDYHSSVEKLNGQNDGANEMADSLDIFDVGRLDQSQARQRLKSDIAETRKILADGMLHRHIEYNEDICRNFRDLRDKLLDVPTNAPELFKLSETIAYPSMCQTLREFESRVARSIEMLSSLLAVTSDMTERHKRLNAETINWLVDIKPIVARSNTLCEAMKSELEDELQRRIVALNLEIEKVLPKFVILDCMDDATRVNDYVEHLRDLVARLQELDRRIETINYEEGLFKFPETCFANVEEIRDILVPVNTLNNLVGEWRRDHAVWLHGPFDYIDAIEVRRKTIHHYRDKFEKLGASLRTKIKLEMQSAGGQSANKRFKIFSGVVDDPDPMQQPAPLTLCSQVIEEVRQFEEHLELIDCVCNPSLRDRHWREMSLIYEQSRKMNLEINDRSSSSATSKNQEFFVPVEHLISAPDAGTTLAKLISLDLAKDIDKYRVISIGANKELALANRLRKMIDKWETIDFRIVPTTDASTIKTFVELDEIETLTEEHEIIIGEMRVSYFVKPIVADLTKFSQSLASVRTIVRGWLSLQSDWHNLELIFRRETINDHHLARARRLFFDVGTNVIGAVETRILDEPRFRAIANESSKLSKLLSYGDETLETVRETVENYVQRVRNLFPRFYFISDREVIDVIFQPKYQKKMSLFVRKCFRDMKSVRCLSAADDDDDKNKSNDGRVTWIIDSGGREFQLIHRSENELNRPVPDDQSSSVDSFVVVEQAIFRTVRDSIVECSRGLYRTEMSNNEDSTEEKIVSTLTNCTIEIAGFCGWSLYWTSEMELALDHLDASTARTSLESRVMKQSRIIETLFSELRGRVARKRRGTLVRFVIHVREQRDIAELMMNKVKKLGGGVARGDFEWRAQIRHYWRDNDVKVAILETEEYYGYEYSGCDEREPLIRTPLTERCYRSLAEAHRYRLHGLVFGPAASGKSRSIEALALILGVDLKIFDCSQRHFDNYRYMDNTFKGLVGRSSPPFSLSSWLLLKHLNLISSRGLSVLAQRITAISSLIDNRCFITGTISNRTGSSSFRCPNSFSDTLKVSFRPIAFAFPDTTRIVEILLFAEDFTTAAILAKKLRLFEKYSSQKSLSHRLTTNGDLYGFSMRTSKFVVKTACALKIRYPEETEDALFLRAIVDVNLSKFTNPSDLTEFQETMNDLFPNVALPPPNYDNLLSAIRRVTGETTIPNNDQDPFLNVILKIIQLFEMLLVRNAVVVVGPALAGKTSIIDTLARSLTLLDHDSPPIDSIRINHASFTNEELFGSYNERSGGTDKLCWNDGIFTRVLRSSATSNRDEKTKSKHWQWLVLDGPLDTSFLDKLTSLLDDNEKTLFLRSGEKLRTNESTSIIFETSSAVRATPSTISRCGIVYLEESLTIGWKMRTRRWIAQHQRDHCDLVPGSSHEHRESQDRNFHEECAVFLRSLLEWSIGACLEFLNKNVTSRSFGLPVNENHMVISVLRLFEMYLGEALGVDDDQQDDSSKERVKSYASNFFSWSQAALLMSIVWGLGGSLDRNSRVELDEFCKSIWRVNDKFPYDVLNTPSDGLIQDNTYVFAAGASGTWRHWSKVLKRENTSGDIIDYFWSSRASSTSYVPTIDSIRYISLFQAHVKCRKPFLVSGETATGKTLYMRHLLRTKTTGHQSNFYSLAADSLINSGSSRSWQSLFLSRMKRISKGVYGPSEGARVCINFIDDMSGTKISRNEGIIRELIRQYYEDSHRQGCWYDIDSGEKIRLNDLMFLGVIDSGSYLNEFSEKSREIDDRQEAVRFFRHFNLYTIDRPSDKSIFRTYYNILLANLRINLFSADVAASVTSIVNATLDVYSSIVQTLRATPTRFHYCFGLRDASRVIDGCSLIHKESAETKLTLMRLWVHETIRVFADRIIDPTNAEWLFVKIRESAASHFKDSWETAFDNLPKYRSNNEPEQLTRESFRYLVFSDFMRITDTLEAEGARNANDGNTTNDMATKQRYEEISCSREALKNRALSYLERYNDHAENSKKLDILIFPNMLEHLMRICRILDITGGSLLMMCFGASSGRRSLTALAAFIKSQTFEEFSPRVIESMMRPNSPGHDNWRDDFKRACTNCIGDVNDDPVFGIDSRIRDCTFFISDREIIGTPNCRSILDDICSLMKTGQATAPSLFTSEERDVIVERSRLLAQKGDRNREMSSDEIMDYFYSKCRDKLHFVLYFDRSGVTRDGIGKEIFGKILNQCSVDCYEDWPEEALFEIGNKFMRNIDIENEIRSGAIVASKYFWDSVLVEGGERTNDNSSTKSRHLRKLPVSAYVHTVKLYGLTINKRQTETRGSRMRYLNGLDKLKLADEEVRKMRSTLTRLRPELELSAEETAETMRKIERENVSVEMATIQVKREEEVANGIAEVAGILKEECEADLAVAIPILEDAIAALNTLKPTDITLVKAMKNPPDTVKLVLAAVCVMLGVAPDRSVDPVTGKKSIDYWAPSKRILGDMNFLQNLKDYDKDNIPIAVMSVVKKSYMNDASFMPHIVAKASSAAEGLCKWVRAMVSYDEVAKVVAPKKEKLAAAERECNANLEFLNEKRTILAALNDKLAALNASLEATLTKKLQLENEVTICTGKLSRAEALIASLAGEKARWHEIAENLARTCDNLAGDILLSCGLVALLSSFPANKRHFHIADWRNELDRLAIPNSGESYEFLGSLKTSELRNRRTESSSHRHHHLAVNSPFNRANSSILRHSLLWPLILDPQNQANMWLKRVESPNGLIIVKPTNPRWFTVICDAIAKNLPVLLENLDRSEYIVKTPAILRYVGTSSSTFRLYMTSRISPNEAADKRFLVEPHDMYKRFCIVNFTLANDALEDRLLEIIVARERPELRDTFDRLMLTSAADRRLLDREENRILGVLSATRINIIEDEKAIETLDRWKALSLEIRTREMETAKATETEMKELRLIYRPLTKYCANLYDTLASLVNFNHMYRFSLDWFVRLYVKSIDTSMRSVILDRRLSYLGSSFTLTLDASVRNALLDEHRLLYSFLLSIKILLDTNRVNREELGALLIDDVPIYDSQDQLATSKRIIMAEELGNLLPDVFKNLSTCLREDSSSWEKYWNADNALPAPWNLKLTDFQRLLLVNRLKPEKTLDQVLQLVTNTLGSNSIADSSTRPGVNVLSRSFDESSCLVPLIFVLPSYLEPFRLIDKWSRTIGYSSKIVRFSMPPTEPREHSEIEDSIEFARQRGGWILLENCHLASDEWLARLEKISESLDNNDNGETALSFRLWLTSYPSTNFPISILHDGTKMYCERPSDRIKQSLLDFYATEPLDDPNFYNTGRGGNNSRIFSKLVYALCFFHAIVTGRNRFYECSWNVPSYEFIDLDLKISIGHLRRVFEKDEAINDVSGRKEDEKSWEKDLLDTLVYLVGECYYAGRILDPTDRNCLNVILQDCCNSKVIRSTTNYLFDDFADCSNNGHEYSIPNRSEYRDFVRHINNSLPNGESPPRIFGLDDSTAVVRDYQKSNYFILSLARSISFIDENITLSHRDTPVSMDIVRDIRTKLLLEDTCTTPGQFDMGKVKNEYPIIYEEPLNSFLIEQITIYNKIMETIRESLIEIEKRRYEHEFNDFLTRNRVPYEWMIISGHDVTTTINCSSLSCFVDALKDRRDFLNNWTKFGHYRGSMWLGGLFACRKFVLASRLTFARKMGIPLDSLVMEYDITNIAFEWKTWKILPVNSADDIDIIHIHGLYLSAGAQWDIERCSLVESLPKTFWNPMPMIRFRPRCLSSAGHAETGKYSCPVKSTPVVNKTSNFYFLGSLSSNYVTNILLDSKDTSVEHWSKRATVLFCNKQ